MKRIKLFNNHCEYWDSNLGNNSNLKISKMVYWASFYVRLVIRMEIKKFKIFGKENNGSLV